LSPTLIPMKEESDFEIMVSGRTYAKLGIRRKPNITWTKSRRHVHLIITVWLYVSLLSSTSFVIIGSIEVAT